MSSDSQKLELLDKKNTGTVDAYPGLTSNQEVPVSARPKIIASLQVFAQTIPPVAPTDLLTDSAFTHGIRQYSTTYPYVVKYTNVSLKSLKYGISYRFSGTDPSHPDTTNILSNAIPDNFDPTGTYQIVVKSSTGVVIQANDASHPWKYDIDAGYLTFFHSTPFSEPSEIPTISYWRYEGVIGLGPGASGSTGTQGSTGQSEATGAQ